MIEKISIIGIIGVGVLGNAIKETFETFETFNTTIIKCYDKYKKNSIECNSVYSSICSSVLDMCDCNIIFLCLPTQYDNETKEYNKSEIDSVCEELNQYKFKGIVILKSTVEPNTTIMLSNKYTNLNIVHSPEFLTARTATEDFKNQKHIILGIVNLYKQIEIYIELDRDPSIDTRTENKFECKIFMTDYLLKFFSQYFPLAKISMCSSTESESVKLFCNSFYATKIQYFTEIKLLCDKLDIDYDNVKNLMISNNWINPMHTDVPGPDGNISFGGACFPKDIQALNSVFNKLHISNAVIDSVVRENKIMRGE